jgi:uncharacterized lipoprotein YddW (UPF0748 family)
MAAVTAVGLALASALASHPAASAPNQDEVRGLWVVRSAMTSPQRIDELVRTAVSGGYNTLLVQVRGRGDAYYQSAIDPRAEDLRTQPASFDPLAVVLERAHAAGLKVHAWFNVNLVSGVVALPRSPAHIVSRQPEWLMVPRQIASTLAPLDPRSAGYVTQLARWTRQQSDTVEGLFLSPIHEGAQQYTLGVVRDLLQRYSVDGLHLDYIRYPTADFDYSAASLAAFRAARLPETTPAERQRLDGQLRTDPLAWTRAFPLGWDAFRLDRLTTLVERIRHVMTETRPGAVLSAAVLPIAADARQQKLQDWSVWAGRGLLDVICPMAYATSAATFAHQVNDTIAGAQGRPVWVGIGAWRMPVARTADHLRAARDRDVAGVLLFSYDSLLTASTPRGSYFTRLRPALVAINNKP